MKTILLGVSDSIPAYKIADITGQLAKFGYSVEILITKSSTTFITPLTLQSLFKSPVYTDVMAETNPSKINHIELTKKADLFLVAPVSANTIGKLAYGIAGNSLSAVALAFYPETPKIIAPAMSMCMYQNPTVQRNIGTLKEVNYQEIIPCEALLTYGDYGRDVLATVEDIFQTVTRILALDSKE